MAFNRSEDTLALTPDEHGQTYYRPLMEASVALQTTNVINTTAKTYRLPVVTATPRGRWTAEGAEIALSDPTVTEVQVTPTKIATLTPISNELFSDSGGEAANIVTNGMIADIAAIIDEAFFGDPTGPEVPDGLRSLASVQTVAAGTSFANIDAFSEAISLAEREGARVTAFTANPDTVLQLAKIKQGKDSNVPLLASDVNALNGLGTAPTTPSRSVQGIPMWSSRFIEPGVVWALPQLSVYSIVRTPATLAFSSDAAFTKDSLMVRATQRLGFLFPHQRAVVKISSGAK